MKKLILALALIAAHSASALDYSDVVGTWRGSRTEYINGQRYTGTQTLNLRKLGNGGFLGRSTLLFPGIGVITASGKYFSGGDYESTAFFRGQVLAVSAGRWSVRRDTIQVKATTRDVTGSYSGNATMRFIGKRTLVVISTLSNGGRVTITLRRR